MDQKIRQPAVPQPPAKRQLGFYSVFSAWECTFFWSIEVGCHRGGIHVLNFSAIPAIFRRNFSAGLRYQIPPLHEVRSTGRRERVSCFSLLAKSFLKIQCCARDSHRRCIGIRTIGRPMQPNWAPNPTNWVNGFFWILCFFYDPKVFFFLLGRRFVHGWK